MKKSETIKILQRLITMFPSFKFGELPDDLGGNVNPVEYWHEQIGDMDFAKAEEAVKRCINKCKYVPTAADIREEYDAILSKEKEELSEIKKYYGYARSYYPGSGEAGYGWKEFSERAKTKEDAVRLQTLIMDYVRFVETSGGTDVIDFAECCKTVRRDGGNITVGNMEYSPK